MSDKFTEDEQAMVREFVAGGRTSMPASVRQRLASVSTDLPLHAGVRRSKLLSAAILLLGATVTALVWWLPRGDRNLATGSGQDPQPAPAPAARAEPGAPPALESVDVQQLGERAAAILVVDLSLPARGDSSVRGGSSVTVLRVLRGDVRPGEKVWLEWDAQAEQVWTDVLDVVDLTAPGAEQSGSWLVALEPIETGADSPAGRRFRSACGRGMRGVRVSKAPPGIAADAELGARLRAEIAAGLTADDPDQVRCAVIALCRWSRCDAGPWLPWHDDTLRAALLKHAESADPDVRMVVAANAPTEFDDCRAALEHLLFDRFAGIRSQVYRRLAQLSPVVTTFISELQAGSSFWEEFTLPSGFSKWRRLCEQAAEKEGISTPLGCWQRQIDKQIAANRLLAALGLADVHEPAAITLLRDLANGTDVHATAAANRGLALRGEREGVRNLRRSVTDGDAKVAMLALDMLRNIGERAFEKDVLEAVEAASHHGDVRIRALAAAGLRELRAVAPHLVDARLADLRRDESLVRLAARD